MPVAAPAADVGDAVTHTQRTQAEWLRHRGLGYAVATYILKVLHTVPPRAVRCAWGKAQEASSLSVLMGLYPTCTLHEVGLCLVDPADLQRYGFAAGHLPPLGASPDALMQRKDAPRTTVEPPTLGSPRAELINLLEQLDALDLGQQLVVQHGQPPGIVECAALEVVEVKNTCPFGTSKGKRCDRYALFDRGPREQVPALWVPQLQMEMLAAGTERALLVTRSATKGVTVFSIDRDDVYIRAMLGVLAYLHKVYVLPRRPPGSQPYKGYKQYTEFVQLTKTVAKRAVVVLHDAEAHRLAPPRNMRLLLDGAPCVAD